MARLRMCGPAVLHEIWESRAANDLSRFSTAEGRTDVRRIEGTPARPLIIIVIYYRADVGLSALPTAQQRLFLVSAYFIRLIQQPIHQINADGWKRMFGSLVCF